MGLLPTGLHSISQKPDWIAPRVEAMVRKEIGANGPLPYQILPGASAGATVGSVMADMARSFTHLRYQTTLLFYIHFALSWPCPFELQVSVTQQGLGALVGKFAYAVPLNRPVRGVLELQGYSFVGDPATTARLNSNRPMLAQAHRLARTRSTIGKFRMTIPQCLQILPRNPGSVLVVHRLADPGLLIGANVGARDLLAFVPTLEACL